MGHLHYMTLPFEINNKNKFLLIDFIFTNFDNFQGKVS